MADKRRLGPMLVNGDGTYTAIFEDGSTARFDGTGRLLEQDDSPNPLRAAAMRSGDEDTVSQLAENASGENRRRFDAGLQLQQDTLKNTYRVNLMNARTQADVARATREYQQGQLALANARLDFDERNAAARLNLDERIAASNLRGPENYFQEADFVRGAASRQDTPLFLQGRQPDFQGRTASPVPVTMDSLAARLGQQAPSAGVGASQDERARQDAGALGAIRQKAMNPHSQIAAGEWERYTPDERKLFLSGVGASGLSESGFLTQLGRSRIGQGFGTRR